MHHHGTKARCLCLESKESIETSAIAYSTLVDGLLAGEATSVMGGAELCNPYIYS